MKKFARKNTISKHLVVRRNTKEKQSDICQRTLDGETAHLGSLAAPGGRDLLAESKDRQDQTHNKCFTVFMSRFNLIAMNLEFGRVTDRNNSSRHKALNDAARRGRHKAAVTPTRPLVQRVRKDPRTFSLIL
jgi:hypothetical protein